MVPKEELEVLSQLISDEEGTYRIRARHRVHYLTIPTHVFDDDTMCRPHLLIPQLPDFPDSDWTRMQIDRSKNSGQLEATISNDALPKVERTWHARYVDVLSLAQTNRFRSAVHEVLYNGSPAVAKIACFDWDMARIERETWAYSILAQRHDPEKARVAPGFLAHLTENGRVMGLLVEKVDGVPANIDDLASCEALVRRVHGMGLIHGDVNRYNFLVDQNDRKRIRLIDFEEAVEYNDEWARIELESIPSELTEETGRGSTIAIYTPKM